MSKQDSGMHSAEHLWHCWMNKRNDEARKNGGEHLSSIYEFKNLVQFLEYGHIRIGEAFKNALPKTHQHCSRSAPEKIEHNRLVCCLGTEVPKCEILISIKTLFDEERERKSPSGLKPYSDVTDEHCYRIMARTCAWHIYKTTTKGKEEWAGVDTSEGYHLDEGDRRFWARVYESMAYNPEQSEEE